MSNRIILTADEGMVLTNGTDYGTIIYLADGIDPNDYYQIPMDEYKAIVEREQEDAVFVGERD